MKLHALILIAAILLGIVAPPALMTARGHGGAPAIGTLDLCSHGAPAFTAGGEMPCLQSAPCAVLHTQIMLASVPDANPLTPFNFTSDNEHPPRS